MLFHLVASNLRVQSDPTGGPLTFTIELGGGGRMAKVAQYSIVIKADSGANVRLNATLLHGPDGRRFVTHSDVIGTDAAPLPVPTEALLVGDADTSILLNEFLAITLTIRDSAALTGQWALVDVYEMRKPF